MKFYIVNNSKSYSNKNGYVLIAETGKLIAGCMSYNKYIAKVQLLKENIDRCLQIANDSIIDVLFIGDDSMTEDELKIRNKEILVKEIQELIRLNV